MTRPPASHRSSPMCCAAVPNLGRSKISPPAPVLVGRDVMTRGLPMTIALTDAKSAAAASARTAARDGFFDDAASDDALIRRIAAGDQLAMRTLFARHRIPLYRWLLRIVRDETVAEDL